MLLAAVCVLGYGFRAYAQQEVRVSAYDKKLYEERVESAIKNFYGSIEIYREQNGSHEILKQIQETELWKGTSNTARFFEDFTQASHGKAYKQSDVRTYLNNYRLAFGGNQSIAIALENFAFGNLYKEGDHYYMKTTFVRVLECDNKEYRLPMEAVCNFMPGLNNINKGGIQSIDKKDSDFNAGNPEPRQTTRTVPIPKVSVTTTTMNAQEKQLFEQGLTHYRASNYSEAEKYLSQLSSHPQVFFYLGYIYSYPEVTQSLSLGFLYTSKAAKNGHAAAQNNLGNMYEEGKFVAKNLRKAFEWYSESAANKNPKAMYNVGRFYYNGLSVSKNVNESFKWLKGSYDLKQDAYTASLLGEHYYYGRGCAVDYGKAVTLFEYAQSKGKKDNVALLENARRQLKQAGSRGAQANVQSQSSSASTQGSRGLTNTTSIALSGTVLSEEGNAPLAGVSIRIKGTQKSTITDIEGRFKLNIPTGSITLVVSYRGYKTVEVGAGERSEINIVLKEEKKTDSKPPGVQYTRVDEGGVPHKKYSNLVDIVPRSAWKLSEFEILGSRTLRTIGNARRKPNSIADAKLRFKKEKTTQFTFVTSFTIDTRNKKTDYAYILLGNMDTPIGLIVREGELKVATVRNNEFEVKKVIEHKPKDGVHRLLFLFNAGRFTLSAYNKKTQKYDNLVTLTGLDIQYIEQLVFGASAGTDMSVSHIATY